MRGQIPQLFIFLAALLVIGATIFIGAKVIGGLSSTACDANDASFKQSIAEVLDENAVYGSRNTVSVPVGCDAVALCFVNATVPAGFSSSDATINVSVHSGVQTNIFLRGRDKVVPVGYDARIVAIDPNDPSAELCIPAVGGEFRFKTHGYGRTVEITP